MSLFIKPTSIKKIYDEYHFRYYKKVVLVLNIVLVGIIACFYIGVFHFEKYIQGVPFAMQLIQGMFPPDFSNIQNWFLPLVDTLAMSIAATLLAAPLSLLFALLASDNIAQNVTLRNTIRGMFNLLRTIPELIMGMIFVAAVGFGALPGALAIGLHSVGMLGKFFFESIEHINKGPVNGVRVSGATEFQVVVHGVLPQVYSRLIDIVLYRWEYNFRASTIMGAVGAGGIGGELIGALRILNYHEVSALLIIIFFMVTFVDMLSAIIRKNVK
jgi:phosphonate transport system permease protein